MFALCSRERNDMELPTLPYRNTYRSSRIISPPPPPPPPHTHIPALSLTTVVHPHPKLAIYWSFCLEEVIIVNRTQVQLTAVLTSSLLLGPKDNLLIIEGSGIKPYAPPVLSLTSATKMPHLWVVFCQDVPSFGRWSCKVIPA